MRPGAGSGRIPPTGDSCGLCHIGSVTSARLNGVAPTPPVRRSASLALARLRTFVSLDSASRATARDRAPGATIDETRGVRRAIVRYIHPKWAGLARQARRSLSASTPHRLRRELRF